MPTSHNLRDIDADSLFSVRVLMAHGDLSTPQQVVSSHKPDLFNVRIDPQ